MRTLSCFRVVRIEDAFMCNGFSKFFPGNYQVFSKACTEVYHMPWSVNSDCTGKPFVLNNRIQIMTKRLLSKNFSLSHIYKVKKRK